MSESTKTIEGPQYMRHPQNFTIFHTHMAPPKELDAATDIRFNKYVLCINLTSLSYTGGQANTAQNEDWMVGFIGNMDQVLVNGKDGVKEPCAFIDFYRRILYDLRCSTRALPNITVWFQSALGIPPRMITKTDGSWRAVLRDYQASFLKDRHNLYIGWLYFHFMGIPGTSDVTIPSEMTLRQVTRGLSSDPIADGMPQAHVEPLVGHEDGMAQGMRPILSEMIQHTPASP